MAVERQYVSSLISLACFTFFIIRHNKHISSHNRSLVCEAWLLIQLLSHGIVTITSPHSFVFITAFIMSVFKASGWVNQYYFHSVNWMRFCSQKICHFKYSVSSERFIFLFGPSKKREKQRNPLKKIPRYINF